MLLLLPYNSGLSGSIPASGGLRFPSFFELTDILHFRIENPSIERNIPAVLLPVDFPRKEEKFLRVNSRGGRSLSLAFNN